MKFLHGLKFFAIWIPKFVKDWVNHIEIRASNKAKQ